MGTDKSGLGDYDAAPGQYIVYTEPKAASIITKGDVCSRDGSGDWIEAPTSNAVGPFGVAVKSKSAGDPDLPILTEGTVIVRADGTIKRGAYVKPSGSTAGEVVEYTAPAAGTTPSQSDINAAGGNWNTVVGRYIGKPGEVGPNELATDAADGDLILIRLGGR